MATTYIYVLHFDTPLAHARHYIGCTANLKQRLTAHANGAAARITEELQVQGLTWRLGGLYSTSHAEMRRQEKALKSMHNSERYCQICHPKDQKRKPGLQAENIHNVPFVATSEALTNSHVDIHGVAELAQEDGPKGMEFIIGLMRKDKDALGFVPVGGKKGIEMLLAKGQIIIAWENGNPCGYAFYTQNYSKTTTNIHQCCIADHARLKGHGTDLVEYIAAKHPETTIIAKVRDDLVANFFWQTVGFTLHHSKQHKTSGSTINHYHRQPERKVQNGQGQDQSESPKDNSGTQAATDHPAGAGTEAAEAAV